MVLTDRARKARLERMIEDAILDAHDEYEQQMGFLTMLVDNFNFPVRGLVVGEEVFVEGFDWEHPGEIVARCRRGGRVYEINVTALEWPGAPPLGAEWIDAYRLWLRGA